MSGPTATNLTLASICDAIESALGAVTGIVRSQSYDELTEGMGSFPTLQVFPVRWNVDARTGTDRSTFKAGLRTTDQTIYCDLFIGPRGGPSPGQQMSTLVGLIDLVNVELKTQTAASPPFDLTGIKACWWTGEHVTLDNSSVLYVGARWTITLRTF